MWELAANWHGKKNTHTRNIHQATAKNVYFGIIYNGQGGGGRGVEGTGRGGGITDYFEENLFVLVM